MTIMPRGAWTLDLPVCFPGRPCVEFTPFGADAVNATAALTPASGAVLAGCLALLGATLVLAVLGLRPRADRRGPAPWLVPVALLLLGAGIVAGTAVDSLFGALGLVYGVEGGGFSLIGSWPEVRLAADAMRCTAVLLLAVVATLATLRLRSAGRTSASR